MTVAVIQVGQALLALSLLMLFTLVGRVHKRYGVRKHRLAVLASLYLIGMSLSAYPDRLFIRLGGFLMGGACVWLATARTPEFEPAAVPVRENDSPLG